MLVLGSTFPGVALAGEADSEGEGSVLPIEVPVPPEFDPGGEEAGLGEVPAAGVGEEGGAVEVEPEVDTETPPAGEVTSAATEAAAEESQSQAVPVPEVSAPAPEPQTAAAPTASEPIANQSIVAPKREQVDRHAARASATTTEAAPPAQPSEEAPPSPEPVATPADPGRHLASKDSYVVRPGDCLWHIAAALLPAGADTEAIEGEVRRLWVLNEDRIGTGDPSLIYAGTTLRLH
jgi:nucleoid-associated protein YgaU